MAKIVEVRNSTAEFLTFVAEGKEDGVEVMYADETIWCTQDAIATLFDKGRTTITEHLANIFNEGELDKDSVCRKFRRTASDGKPYNVQFYQYADRIEIENHGGLYGRANEQNFPNVNDYRNLIVAEGMKVLGFVNRQSRGVQKVQRELRENENGEAVYDFGYQTAVLVCEKKSPRGERLKEEAIRNGWLKENEVKTPIDGGKLASQLPKMGENESKTDIDGPKLTSKTDFPTLLIKNVYDLLKMNRKIKYSQMEDNLGVTERTIARAIEWLKENGYINPERSKIKGEWQLL